MEMPPPPDSECSVAEVAEMPHSDSPPALVDVREPGEWEIAHLEGALPISQRLIEEMMDNWERERPIVCYCHHGVRSLQATHFLRTQGFSNVRSMRGGLDAWAREIDPAMPRY